MSSTFVSAKLNYLIFERLSVPSTNAYYIIAYPKWKLICMYVEWKTYQQITYVFSFPVHHFPNIWSIAFVDYYASILQQMWNIFCCHLNNILIISQKIIALMLMMRCHVPRATSLIRVSAKMEKLFNVNCISLEEITFAKSIGKFNFMHRIGKFWYEWVSVHICTLDNMYIVHCILHMPTNWWHSKNLKSFLMILNHFWW